MLKTPIDGPRDPNLDRIIIYIITQGVKAWLTPQKDGLSTQVALIVPTSRIERFTNRQRSTDALVVEELLKLTDSLIEAGAWVTSEVAVRVVHGSALKSCVLCNIMSSDTRLTLLCVKQNGTDSEISAHSCKGTPSPGMTLLNRRQPTGSICRTLNSGVGTVRALTCRFGWIKFPPRNVTRSSCLLQPRATAKGKIQEKRETCMEHSVVRCQRCSTCTSSNDTSSWIWQLRFLSSLQRATNGCRLLPSKKSQCHVRCSDSWDTLLNTKTALDLNTSVAF